MSHDEVGNAPGVRDWEGEGGDPPPKVRGADGDSILDWISRHERLCLIALVLAAVILRVLLVHGAPTSIGYFYDRYDHSVMVIYYAGRLPRANDCSTCYHPPLAAILGYAFFSAGMRLSGGDEQRALAVLTLLSTLSAAITAWYGYRLLRLFAVSGWPLILAMGVMLALPALFIASYGVDDDIVLTAAMTGFVFYLARYFRAGPAVEWRDIVGIGVCSGLAASIKYSGLLALVIAGEVFALRLATGPNRSRTIVYGLAALSLSATIGSWRYVDNFQRHGTPLFTRWTDSREIFGERQWDLYDFLSFDLGSLLELARDEAPPGLLVELPVYRSVWTALHGQAWSDMSLFSNPTRHSSGLRYFPSRGIPPWLTSSVLVLGILPTLLAALGCAATLRQSALWPVGIVCATTLISYSFWLPTDYWGVKTKYILFLLPAYALYLALGLDALRRRAPGPVWRSVACLVLLLVGLAHSYDLAFAVGDHNPRHQIRVPRERIRRIWRRSGIHEERPVAPQQLAPLAVIEGV